MATVDIDISDSEMFSTKIPIVTHDGEDNRFDTADYAVFVVMLLISAIIGVYYALQSKKAEGNTQDFLMGSRSMGMLDNYHLIKSNILSPCLI